MQHILRFIQLVVSVGSHVYRWDVRSRAVEDSCDIAKIIASAPGQDPVSFPSTQLVSLVHHCSYILAGSTAGFVVVVNAMTFTTLMCISPHKMANYRTLYSIQPLTDNKFLTLGIGYNNALMSSDSKSNARPPIHMLSWYINPCSS